MPTRTISQIFQVILFRLLFHLPIRRGRRNRNGRRSRRIVHLDLPRMYVKFGLLYQRISHLLSCYIIDWQISFKIIGDMSKVSMRANFQERIKQPHNWKVMVAVPLSLVHQMEDHTIHVVWSQILYSMVLALLKSLTIDTFGPPVLLNVGGSSVTNQTYNMSDNNIAWSSDSARFGKTSYTVDQVVPPPNWALRYPDGYTNQTGLPDLSTWYEFQVWMRTAGLPTFSKLALRNPDEVMRAGTYQVDIDLSTPNFKRRWW
jgi:hypothetical protein